jgi:hypothetical protein
MPAVLKVLFAIWGVLTVAVGGAMTALHSQPLPDQLAFRGPREPGWSVLHVVDQKCPCSQVVIARLLSRGAWPGVKETVAVVHAKNAELPSALERAGFAALVLEPEALEAQTGVTAAPVLVIRSPDGSVRYSGAYASRRSQPPEDLSLFTRVQSGESVEPYPLFGCAVGRALARQVDPLNLKGTP